MPQSNAEPGQAERQPRSLFVKAITPIPGEHHGRGGRPWLIVLLAFAVPGTLAPIPAQANNYGESLAWQFRTSTDRVNQAALLDLIAKKRGGYYAAPIYTTNIARQYVCSITASATGNSNGQSAVANSPAVTGATATASGNDSATTIDSGRAATAADTVQRNSGAVSAGVNGSTMTAVRGVAWQALNSSQSNSGNQSASVLGSSACAFGVLN
ncbi:hypothetical protein GCM10009087_18180 [Sphingomonas oligophenolica]|uniref:Uncharacterized protein n=1 Tax=Sphingomonas oligophenolica TaxID=301154 RepID=A0ABU9Y3F7_9SPHN